MVNFVFYAIKHVVSCTCAFTCKPDAQLSETGFRCKGGRGGKSVNSGNSNSKGGSKASQQSTKRTRDDSKVIILIDRFSIEAHSLFNFGPKVWEKMQVRDKQ